MMPETPCAILFLVCARFCSIRICNQLCKRLVFPDRLVGAQEFQTSSYMMAKVFLASPCAGAGKVVELARKYDNIGNLFLAMASALPPLLQEFLVFECVRELATATVKRVSGDGYSPAEWHSRIGLFLGSLASSFPHLDVAVVFRFVMSQLQGQLNPRSRDAQVDVQILESIFRASFGVRLMLSANAFCDNSHPAYRRPAQLQVAANCQMTRCVAL
jgi:hypothetical protein